jgi:hypothetical protein
LIVVNPSTRQFNIPGADLVFGVTADANSAIKHFQCPRYVGNNVDIASSFVRINYQNPHGEIDFYLVKEVTVDGDNVLFDWELHPKVTMYKGNVSFVMCVTGPDAKVKWHTTLGRGQVLEGLEPDNALVETQTEDGIAALLAMVEAQTAAVEDKGAEWVRNVQSEGTDQIVAVQTAGAEAKTAAVAEIEDKGKNVRESIPDDYTSLGNAVDILVRGGAGANVCEAEGTAIAVKDASNMAIHGLRIFGRSTQDGTPTPDAPVEIVSVESPTVRVCGENILNPDELTQKTQYHGIIAEYEGNGIFHFYGTVTSTQSTSHFTTELTIPIDPHRGYTLCAEVVEGSITGQTRLHPYLSVGKAPGNRMNWLAAKVDSGTAVGSVVYNTAKATDFMADGKFITRFWVYVALPTIGDVIDIRMRIWATKTDVPVAYKPYTGRNVGITRPIRGIPVTSGGNYTDINGQQWFCDEVDLERGVYVQRTKKVTLTGAMNIGKSLPNDEASWMYYYVTPNKEMNDTVPVLCDSLQYKTSLSPYNSIGFRNSNDGNSVIYFNMSTYMTENKIDALGAVLNEYPITFVYSLMEPIETPLSETELAAYRDLHTYKPNTTIVNDSGAHMKVEYAADTKLYIDNKLAALVGNT